MSEQGDVPIAQPDEPDLPLSTAFAELDKALDDLFHKPWDEAVAKGAAQKEFLRDGDGNIVDIKFTQNGNTANLKEVMPGDYVLDFKGTRGHLQIGTNLVVVPPDYMQGFPNEQNITLLHEVGHALLYKQDKEYFDNLTFQQFPLELGINVIRDIILVRSPEDRERYLASKRLEIEEKFAGYPPEYVQAQLKIALDIPTTIEQVGARVQRNCQEFTEKFQGEGFHLDKIQGAVKKYQEIFEEAKNEQDVDKLKIHGQEAEATANKLNVENKVRAERGAWAIGLKGLKLFRNKGVNLYTGTRQELFNDVYGEHSLGSYQNVYDQDTTSDTFFVRKSNVKTTSASK